MSISPTMAFITFNILILIAILEFPIALIEVNFYLHGNT